MDLKSDVALYNHSFSTSYFPRKCKCVPKRLAMKVHHVKVFDTLGLYAWIHIR